LGEIIIIIIIIIITTTIFIMLSSWQSHCESSLGSRDEYRNGASDEWSNPSKAILQISIAVFSSAVEIFF